MGRGRAKAKQTKVARELKYFTPDTDLSALERELRARQAAERGDQPDPYAAYAEPDTTEYDDSDDDGLSEYERWVASGS